MFGLRRPLKPNKRKNAGFWSLVSFHYMNDFFKLGRSRPLTFEDCWELEDKNQASEKVTQLESFWLDELENEHPSLSRRGSSNDFESFKEQN